jgi:hypothetical protein
MLLNSVRLGIFIVIFIPLFEVHLKKKVFKLCFLEPQNELTIEFMFLGFTAPVKCVTSAFRDKPHKIERT